MKHFEEQFATLSVADHEPPSLQQMRQMAFDRFKEIGFPQQSWEAWRFTNVKKVQKSDFRLAAGKDLPAGSNEAEDRLQIPTLLFVNGHYQPDLSTVPRGLTVNTLLESYKVDAKLVTNGYEGGTSPFAVLNTAMMNSGLHLHFSDAFDADSAVRFLYLTTKLSEPIMNHPRLVVDVAESAQATIIEEYRGDDEYSYWNNALTILRAGRNSQLNHIRIQNESTSASHLGTTFYKVPTDGTVHGSYLSSGSTLHRHDVNVTLSGQGADVTLNGLCLTRESQHADHNIIMDHASENVTSRMLFKYILSDKSSGVFNGRAVVRQDAQKIDANQANNNLLLSGDALMNSNPQLEIYADDVRCTHGSTTGQISEDALFYLRSRGLNSLSARALLINGFANEVIEEIKNDSVKEFTRNLLESWLDGVTHG